jgi:hypothetical protein
MEPATVQPDLSSQALRRLRSSPVLDFQIQLQSVVCAQREQRASKCVTVASATVQPVPRVKKHYAPESELDKPERIPNPKHLHPLNIIASVLLHSPDASSTMQSVTVRWCWNWRRALKEIVKPAEYWIVHTLPPIACTTELSRTHELAGLGELWVRPFESRETASSRKRAF